MAKNLTKILFALFVLGVGFALIYPTIKMNKLIEESTKIDSELEIGTKYIYSDEDIAKFKEIGENRQQEYIEKYNLKPGDDFTTSDFYFPGMFEDLAKQAGAEDIDNYIQTNLRSSIYNGGISREIFKTNELQFLDVLNKDLSLKNPELFSGFTSVGNQFVQSLESRDDYFESEYYPALRYFDKHYKDKNGSALRGIINTALNEGTTYIHEYYSLSNHDLENKIIGSDINVVKTFKENFNKKSTIPLISFLTARPSYYHFFDYNVKVKEKPNYTPLPEKYNYFTDNKNYFTRYYPVSVWKDGEKSYTVDIETERPVDRIGAAQIFNDILQNFLINPDLSLPFYENIKDIPFSLSIRINHNGDINNYLFPEYTYGTITPAYYYDKDKNLKSSFPELYGTSLYGLYDWYPNEEAQVWINDFFDTLNIAIENNDRFSIFETIESISKEYNVNYQEVENVIISYFWRHD